MNERTKEIMFKAGIVAMNADHVVFEKLQLERFAELVRQDEREACAKLCEEFAKFFGEKGEYATHELHRREWETLVGCAKAIRARGNT